MFSEDQRFWILAHVFTDLGFLDLGSCFQRTKGFWILAHVFRDLGFLDPDSCFQRPRIFGSWLMFSEDQGVGLSADFALSGIQSETGYIITCSFYLHFKFATLSRI
ncbi:hypothetical protein CFP56_008087 [Quercus suber]|uniref:Uncharacterized protein n=1 Tax=Quercus suber TaxID=58331 RepID=A0AAW0L3V2_QUESU